MKSEFKPVTAVTMGDPAGIGPEIVVGTMLDKELYDSCKMFEVLQFWTERQKFLAKN